MGPHFLRALALPGAVALLALGGCGSSTTGSSSGAAPSGSPAATSASPATTGGSSGAGALSADAASAKTGDVPDTQNFLTFSDPTLRISIVYPEGWVVKKAADGVSFTDKNNQVRVALSKGAPPTAATVAAKLAALKSSAPTLAITAAPQTVRLPSGSAIRATNTTESAPHPVTGKTLKLTVDRYALAHAGRVAVVDLGTPVGVDNIDAYKKLIGSFKWR